MATYEEQAYNEQLPYHEEEEEEMPMEDEQAAADDGMQGQGEQKPEEEVFYFNGKPIKFDEYRRYSKRLDPDAEVDETDSWYYSDKNREIRGPFTTYRMRKWHLKNKIPPTLWVKPCPRAGYIVSQNRGFAPVHTIYPELLDAFIVDIEEDRDSFPQLYD